MTEQEIRDNAPDGATHYRVRKFNAGICYYKPFSEKLFIAMDGSLRLSKPSDELKPL